MSDDEMPPQPKTTQLPAVPAWAIEMTQAMKDGFRVTNANIEVVANDLGVVKERVTILENERAKLSGGVRGLSTSNAEQDAQLAQERASREALALKVDKLTETQALQLAILSRLDKFAANPNVKIILAIVATALASWATSRGLK